MAAEVDEVEDLTCCSICLDPYDVDIRKPKFLKCHHTFCLECIKTLPRSKGAMIDCPKCRKRMRCSPGKESELSNNPYALHMITAGNNNNPTPAPKTELPIHQGRWCTNCRKEAVPTCIADHTTFSMGSKTAEFCLQLLESKHLNEAQLISIIQERKEARTYLHEVSTAHKLVGEAIQRLEDENNAHFVQMNSLLEGSRPIKEDETAQSLSLKLEEATDLIKEELKNVELLNKTYLRHVNGKTKIKFVCHRQGKRFNCNMPLLEQGVNSNNQNQVDKRKMLKAATHILLSLLDIDDHPIADPSVPPSLPAVTPGTSLAPPAPVAIIPRIIPAVPIQDTFVFAMTFFRSKINIGTVFIRPATHFYGPPLSASFGNFKVSTPAFTLFGACIDKACPDSFVTVPGIVILLQKLFPNPINSKSVADSETSDPWDVKLVSNTHECGSAAGYQMVFLLNKVEQWNQRWSRTILFGKIVGGRNVIESLSKTPILDRGGFTIQVDYRNSS